MRSSIATVTIRGFSPMTYSRPHQEPKLDGEQPDAYDKRTWKSKAHVNKDGFVVIPSVAMRRALSATAKYLKEKIPGQKNATWTAKFESGISIVEDIVTDVREGDLIPHDVYVNADGIRGSGRRVWRRFPQVNPGWTATFDIVIVDPIITKDILAKMIEAAGIFNGIGQYRPQNGGENGRFTVVDIKFEDNREFKPVVKR